MIEKGTTVENKGAKLGKHITGKFVVKANDSPHGVVSWETKLLSVREPEDLPSTATVYIVREQGARGTIDVVYETVPKRDVPEENRAIVGRDYEATQGTILMRENVTRVPIQITLLPDDNPEAPESFLINITEVTYLGGSATGSLPSIKGGDLELIEVMISENDNPRGIVQFDVTRNLLGVLEAYEIPDQDYVMKIGVGRSKGVYATLEVTWIAIMESATEEDLGPLKGSVIIPEGERKAFIDIDIFDDDIPEGVETVKGGADMVPDKTVKVEIVRNDSPNGLFSFADTQMSVTESPSVAEPSSVNFLVTRAQRQGGTSQRAMETRAQRAK